VFLKIKSAIDRRRKILNILHAKYTFDKLNTDQQGEVIKRVKHILLEGGGGLDVEKTFNRLTDLQLYCLYSLAMAELYIPSATGKYSWAYISRPLIIPEKLEKELGTQIDFFEYEYKVKLNFGK